MSVGTAGEVGSYEEACTQHRWEVPRRYNIAADVCDRWPAERPAMVFEDFRGNERGVRWGEQRSLANRAANLLASRGVERGDRVAVCAPASPETAAFFLGTWKLGAILLSLSVLYGDEGIRHRASDSAARLIVTDAGRADDVIISAGYRIGPFEVESACIEHPAVREAAAVASPDPQRGHVVKAFCVLGKGHEPSEELAAEIQGLVRRHLSAYAYPRQIEFVDDLPKTLAGKIRRIELREREAGGRR